MKLKIDDIKVKNRIREDLGDLTSLEQSITTYGLFNPILVNQNYELLAGARRLQACKNLGWQEIESTIIETNHDLLKLEIESHENLMRKDFSHHEVNKIIDRKVNLLKKGVHHRIIRFFKKLFQDIKLFFHRIFKGKPATISKEKIAQK